MVDAPLLASISKTAAIAKSCVDASQPFGGMSVLVSGDFDQFPPISPRGALYMTADAEESQDLNAMMASVISTGTRSCAKFDTC